MKKFLLISLAAITSAVALRAQSNPKATPPQLPEGPLIIKTPTDLKTLITITGPSSKAAAAGQTNAGKPAVLKRIIIIQFGDTEIEDTAEADGKRSQTWRTGSFRAIFDPVSKEATVAPTRPADSSGRVDAANGYPGFEWISAKNCSGVEKLQGKDYIAFRDRETESIAYVDLGTRLPAISKQVDATYTYEFTPAPEGSVTLPAQVQQAISQYKARQALGARRAAKTY